MTSVSGIQCLCWLNIHCRGYSRQSLVWLVEYLVQLSSQAAVIIKTILSFSSTFFQCQRSVSWLVLCVTTTLPQCMGLRSSKLWIFYGLQYWYRPDLLFIPALHYRPFLALCYKWNWNAWYGNADLVNGDWIWFFFFYMTVAVASESKFEFFMG